MPNVSSLVYTTPTIGRHRLPVRVHPGHGTRAFRQCRRHYGRERIVCACAAHSPWMALRATTPSAVKDVPGLPGARPGVWRLGPGVCGSAVRPGLTGYQAPARHVATRIGLISNIYRDVPCEDTFRIL